MSTSETPSAHLPLTGVRVVDLTTNMSGPLATMVLADQGADVVKVEPTTGDVIRTIGTGRNGMSAYFANLNRGKRAIGIDLTTEAGAAVVQRLTTDADVFVQNFRPGVAERMGLGPETMTAAHPRLVYASISGFGRDGPLATAPAYDHVVQALAGYAALQTDQSGLPSLVRQGVIDKATAYTTAQAITAALLARTETGRGARIDVSMLDVALAFLWPDGMMNNTIVEPDTVLPPVSRSFRVTPTCDGAVVLVTLTSGEMSRLVDALLDDPGAPDLADSADRMRDGATVMREVRARVAELTTAEVVARLTAADVPCAPVLGLDTLHTHAQIVAAGSISAFEHPVLGPVRQARPAARFDGQAAPPAFPALDLDTHTDAILGEAGYGADAIAELRSQAVLGGLPPNRRPDSR
ncbi:MAG: CoA transferase [Acidimicrobiia bacterium]|nr:CoA transferase [Acidimicrobiia bacterium]